MVGRRREEERKGEGEGQCREIEGRVESQDVGVMEEEGGGGKRGEAEEGKDNGGVSDKALDRGERQRMVERKTHTT